MGFSAIYQSSCDNGSDIRVIEFNDDLDLDHYLNPIALILCYFVVAITSKVLLGPQVIYLVKASTTFNVVEYISHSNSAQIIQPPPLFDVV